MFFYRNILSKHAIADLQAGCAGFINQLAGHTPLSALLTTNSAEELFKKNNGLIFSSDMLNY